MPSPPRPSRASCPDPDDVVRARPQKSPETSHFIVNFLILVRVERYQAVKADLTYALNIQTARMESYWKRAPNPPADFLFTNLDRPCPLVEGSLQQTPIRTVARELHNGLRVRGSIRVDSPAPDYSLETSNPYRIVVGYTTSNSGMQRHPFHL